MSAAVKLEWRELDDKSRLAIVTIDRTDAANAFNAEIMGLLTQHFAAAKAAFAEDPYSCRAVVLRGAGKHFSAGADLNWMQSSARLSQQENVRDAGQLTALFEELWHLPMPTISVVQGAAFGGAVGLAACTDVCIAAVDAKFCLSEVRLGLLPAVILPYLGRKMRPGQLRRYSLSAAVFDGAAACDAGLVDVAVTADELTSTLTQEIKQMLSGGPLAQARLKELTRNLSSGAWSQSEKTAQAIAGARTGKEGQAGLASFFAKEKAPWTVNLPETWTIDAMRKEPDA